MPQAVAVPAVAGAGLLSSLLGNRAQNNAAKDQANLYNDWLKSRQTGVQDILAQIANAGGGNPFGPQVNTSQGGSNSTTNSSSSSHTSATSQPFILENYKGIEGMLREGAEGRLKRGSSLPPGFAENRVREINRGYAGADSAAKNTAARFGLSGQQAFGLASPNETARAGDIADFRGSLPLMERQMQTEDMNLAQMLTEAFGKGTATESQTNTTGTSNTVGSQWGQSTSPADLGGLANLLLPPGPQQSGQTGVSGVGQGLGSIGQLLGFLLGQGLLGKQGQPGGQFGPAGPPPSPYGYG